MNTKLKNNLPLIFLILGGLLIIGGILGSAVFIGAYFLLPVESSSASAAATASSSFETGETAGLSVFFPVIHNIHAQVVHSSPIGTGVFKTICSALEMTKPFLSCMK